MTPSGLGQSDGVHTVGFEVYGIRGNVAVPDSDLIAAVIEQLPLHANRRDPGPGDRRLSLERADDGRYVVLDEGAEVIRTPQVEEALALLRRQLFFLAVDHARDHLVVSAGVVAHEGRAIVLTGPTMAGKSALVAALLRAGAVYYTDDWGVFDPEGRVLPYPGLLFIRGQGKVSADSLGAATGEAPVPVGTIAGISYRPGGRWDTRERTPGEGALMLLRHAYGMDDPSAAIGIARTAASGTLVLEGERGEADEAAAALLEIASQASSGGP